MLMDVGGLPGLKMALEQMPSLVEQLTELYDVDLGADDQTNTVEIAQLRIRQMAEAIPMMAQMAGAIPPTEIQPDPMTGEPVEVPVDPVAVMGEQLLAILQPPIEVEELGHLSSINYLRDWLTTDEGRTADPMLRAGVKAMIAAHIQGLMTEAALTGQMSMMAGPPQDDGLKGPQDEPKKSGEKSASPTPPREDREQATKEGTKRPYPNRNTTQEIQETA